MVTPSIEKHLEETEEMKSCQLRQLLLQPFGLIALEELLVSIPTTITFAQ